MNEGENQKPGQHHILQMGALSKAERNLKHQNGGEESRNSGRRERPTLKKLQAHTYHCRREDKMDSKAPDRQDLCHREEFFQPSRLFDALKVLKGRLYVGRLPCPSNTYLTYLLDHILGRTQASQTPPHAGTNIIQALPSTQETSQPT